MKYRRQRTCPHVIHRVTDLKVHLVCVTKYRDEIFSEPELTLIEKVFHDVAKKMKMQILEINAEKEHLIALIEYPRLAICFQNS